MAPKLMTTINYTCGLLMLFILSSNAIKMSHVEHSQEAHACPPNGITSYGRTDGFGRRYFSLMSAYCWAAYLNRPYCTTQWSPLEHDLDASTMFKWVGADNFGPPAKADTEKVRDIHTVWKPRKIRDPKVRKALSEIRDFYMNAGEKILSHFDKNASRYFVNIAWHLRRGDTNSTNFPRGYFSNDDVIDAMSNIDWLRAGGVQLFSDRSSSGLHELSRYFSNMRAIHFYSQGKIDDYLDIVRKCKALSIDCVWHLNDDVRSTHYHMSQADVLVSAGSSLSGTAGLLNTGIVLRDTSLLTHRIGAAKKMDDEDKFQNLIDLGLEWSLPQTA